MRRRLQKQLQRELDEARAGRLADARAAEQALARARSAARRDLRALQLELDDEVVLDVLRKSHPCSRLGTEGGDDKDNEEEQQFNMPLERFTFTYWLDLDSYFREWLVHQSFYT